MIHDDNNDVRFFYPGKYFHLVITIHCYPSQVAVYENAIKVTIDGPRLPRNKHSEFWNEKMMTMMMKFAVVAGKENGFFYLFLNTTSALKCCMAK